MRPNPNAFLWFRTPDPELDRYVTHARAYQRAYYAAHQEKIRAYYAAYREEKRAYNRAYRAAHKQTAPILFQREGWIALGKGELRIPRMTQMGVAFA